MKFSPLLQCNNNLHSSTYQTLFYTCMSQNYLLSTLFLEINNIFDFFICSICLRFYCKRDRGRDCMENPEKTTDLPQITDKLYHIILYWVHHTMSGIRARFSDDSLGTDCTDSCNPTTIPNPKTVFIVKISNSKNKIV
jgi:hypothetical protein